MIEIKETLRHWRAILIVGLLTLAAGALAAGIGDHIPGFIDGLARIGSSRVSSGVDAGNWGKYLSTRPPQTSR